MEGSNSGGGSRRQRLRAWVFTIPLSSTFSVGETAPGDNDDGKWWDPWATCFCEETVRYVVAGLETCPETGRLHWQGYVEFTQAVDLSRVKQELDCAWVHLEPRRGTQQQAMDYCKKGDSGVLDDDGDKILFEEGTPAADGKRGRGTKNNNYAKMLEAPTYQEAMQLCQELEPADYVRFNSAVKRGLIAHYRKRTLFIREMSTFSKPPCPDDWMTKYAILVTGISNAGKTAWCLAHFKKPYLVSHIDQLKEFNHLEHDGLVFDDMSFEHWPVEACINLVDLEYDREVNCRHHTGFLPANFPRMFTSNRAVLHVLNFKDANEEQCKALDRRTKHVHVVDSLIKK